MTNYGTYRSEWHQNCALWWHLSTLLLWLNMSTISYCIHNHRQDGVNILIIVQNLASLKTLTKSCLEFNWCVKQYLSQSLHDDRVLHSGNYTISGLFIQEFILDNNILCIGSRISSIYMLRTHLDKMWSEYTMYSSMYDNNLYFKYKCSQYASQYIKYGHDI